MTHSPGFLKLVNDAKSRVKRPISKATRKCWRGGRDAAHVGGYARRQRVQAGHVKGAVHLSKGIIERDIEAKVSR
jgi:hypothetical protein